MTTSLSPRHALRRAAVAAFVPAAALLAGFTTPRTFDRAPARTITITAKDYSFIAPDTITAGRTTIKLLNRGKEMHHVQLVRIEAGHTLKDFFDVMQKPEGPPPAWVRDMGGPNTPGPGGESAATLELAPGNYAVLCFIPGPDGKPHVMKGMAKPLTVVAPRAGNVVQAGAPSPTSTIELADYHFALSTPLVKGTNVVRVKNTAKQSHEVLVVRLAPGKTAADVAAWVEKQAGPPPGAPIGGTTGLATGEWNDVTLKLTPGSYALLCFIPDATDGKPHVAHGMATQFTVK